MAEENNNERYDFIVVGAGPAGSALSSRLAHLLPKHTILLLEAGGPSPTPPSQTLYDRYTAFRTPGLNYGYTTVPQTRLHDVAVDYSRGKGLGGTSLINFAIWNRGPRDDYDEWARIVRSDVFGWENVKRVYEGIENMQDPAYEDTKQRYIKLESDTHGHDGPVDVEYAARWENWIPDLLDGIEQAGAGLGWAWNRDLNDGDPIGVGFGPATAKDGIRVTARTAYLSERPENLKVVEGVSVARVVWEGKKAIGVESVGGEKFFAAKEVILSAGALDSPRLLLLSGIGPRTEVDKFGIPVVHDLPGVGKNLQDHCHYPVSAVFETDCTGPLSYVNGSYLLGFLKDADLYESEEFKSLDPATQAHLKKATVPSWELGTGLPKLGPPLPGPPRQYLNTIGVLMNPQSRGTVTLQSADPREAALFDPKLMSHPYDQRVLITAGRRILEFMKTPEIAKTLEGPANMPASDTDEDILAFIKLNLRSTWHMSGTCKMGTDEDERAVVNSNFSVRGVEGLRVVDLSVLPFLVNAHPVGAAYLVGEIAAKLVGEQHER
ncbi:hypothetical protein FB567DRAFT_487608 [Paraphoma chrysanthemicola]|uniref:Glucose-methanol-choline oxidoreductase N-terminal domain-containing protein n=1 Tax=Paraphoma chrysanthemicola TaxID=798071 RepID=A0A8K0W424_9PLEO|nr:hypothetical protein FB567DRAFT_487608 [Paraphoma chrysanthemicola]